MLLHIGRLYWPQISDKYELDRESSFDPNKNDLLIVGGGISGALSAYRLSKEGYRVTLIEKHAIATGSTAASTGLIQYMSDRGLSYYIDKIGYDQARFFYDQSVGAIETLIEIDKEIANIEVPTFEVKESLILATEREKLDDLKEEVEKQRQAGYGARFYDQKALESKGIRAFGGLCAKPDIGMNPYGFVHRLIKEGVESYGLQVLEGTEFISLRQGEEGLRVKWRREGEVQDHCFKRVLFSTGYEPVDFLRKALQKLQVNKTFVTVSDNDINVRDETDYLVWEMKDPYTYFRLTFEGSLMIGGLDEENETLLEEDSEKNRDKLISLTKEILKDQIDIRGAYSYAALFGESKDELPYIGLDPNNSNIMVICGAGGNGTVYSTIGSNFALDWMADRDLEDYKLFRLNRE